MRRRGVPDAVGGIRLACRHADDGGADYGAVTPAVAHYGADANSDYPHVPALGYALGGSRRARAYCWY
ncbi:hypothetical protein DMI60_25210 [Escherichia coli]|nr:hypothetical protein [Escherichia coli]